jgi:hypothetical protein
MTWGAPKRGDRNLEFRIQNPEVRSQEPEVRIPAPFPMAIKPERLVRINPRI